jgi:hypothetical protein
MKDEPLRNVKCFRLDMDGTFNQCLNDSPYAAPGMLCVTYAAERQSPNGDHTGGFVQKSGRISSWDLAVGKGAIGEAILFNVYALALSHHLESWLLGRLG